MSGKNEGAGIESLEEETMGAEGIGFPPQREQKKSPDFSMWMEKPGLITGDDLLSQDLSSHYHRRTRVSLPGSEWDRVVPLCYGHQRVLFITS